MVESGRILTCDACKWYKIAVVCAVAAETLGSGLHPWPCWDRAMFLFGGDDVTDGGGLDRPCQVT